MPGSEAAHEVRRADAKASPSGLSLWINRGFVLSRFVGVQAIVQLLGFIAGITILHSLSPSEYALYTIAGSMLGLLTQLSDVGVGNGLLAIGGGVWNDRFLLGKLLASAIQCRRMFVIGAALVVTPLLGSLCFRAGASIGYTGLLIGLVWLSAVAQLSASIYTAAPRLHSQIRRLQRLDLGGATGRVLLIGVGLAVHLNAAYALTVTAVSVAVQAVVARQWTFGLVDGSAPATPELRRKLLVLVLRQLPNAVFYCLLGQMTILVIGIFGQSQQIAEVGALGRLSAVLAIVGSVVSTILLPRFARARGHRQLARQYFAIVGGFAFAGLTVLVLCAVFSREVFWILGSRYAHLEHMAVWMVFAALCSSLVGILWSLNAARGWTRGVWLTIPAIVLAQILLAPCLDLSTVKGAVLFGCLPLLAAVGVLFPIAWKGMQQSQATTL